MDDRDEHLAWCKKRALEYWRAGDLVSAVTSMGSDMDKHTETKCHAALLMLGAMYATQFDYDGVKRWIEGFR